MRRSNEALLSTAALILGSTAPSFGSEIHFALVTNIPRIESLATDFAASGGPVVVDVVVRYDPLGKLTCAAGSTLDGAAASCSGSNGPTGVALTVAGGGATAKISADLQTSLATVKYKGPKGKAALSGVPVSISSAAPVTSEISIVANADAAGVVSGSGEITSGFGNDGASAGILTGKLRRGKLVQGIPQPDKIKWSLAQGSQKVSFSGTSLGLEFVGSLKVKIPPVKGTYASFHLPSFTLPPLPAAFAGAVTTAPSGPQPPAPLAGATIVVRSDLNGDGAIGSGESGSTLTDFRGAYALAFPVLEGRPVQVEARAEGFAPSVKVVSSVSPGSAVPHAFVLKTTETVSVTGGAAALPGGKLRIEGLPASVASVEGRVFDPTTEAAQFPGGFADSDDNLLVSSVFASLQARDAQGNVISNVGGQAELRMLVPKSTWVTLRDLVQGNGKIDVPLYSFVESSGEWTRAPRDGWLEDSSGALLPESQLATVRSGAYSGSVWAAGPVSHLSWWNVDWPVETHSSLVGTVVDGAGDPVGGAMVSIRGVTYDGTSAPTVTRADGSFCIDAFRSELAGEDLDGDGTTGETHQVDVIVFHGEALYRLGPYDTPAAHSSCSLDGGSGGLDVGSLALTPENQALPDICTVSGQVLFSGISVGDVHSPLAPGSPVAGAGVAGFDATALDELVACYSLGTCQPIAFSDEAGHFELTTPVRTSLDVFVRHDEVYGSEGTGVYEGQASVPDCPSAPLVVQADFRFEPTPTFVAQIMDAGHNVVGSCYITEDEANCTVATETRYFFGTASSVPIPPGSLGAWFTVDLYEYTNDPDPVYAGMLALSVSTLPPQGITGTWSASGPDLNIAGTWVDQGSGNVTLMDDQGGQLGYCSLYSTIADCIVYTETGYLTGSASLVLYRPQQTGPWFSVALYDTSTGPDPVFAGTLSLSVQTLPPGVFTGAWSATGPGVNLNGPWTAQVY